MFLGHKPVSFSSFVKCLAACRSLGLCCLTVLHLLSVGNSRWLMAAVSIQKHHTSLRRDGSVNVTAGCVPRLVILLRVSAAPWLVLINHNIRYRALHLRTRFLHGAPRRPLSWG